MSSGRRPGGFKVGGSDWMGRGEDGVVAVRGGTGVESFAYYPFLGVEWVKETPLCQLDMSIMVFWMQLGYRSLQARRL